MATRYDISRLQPAIRLSDGRVRADAHLTRCGVFVYTQPDGTVRRELRPAEEVFRPDSLASFAQAPVTDDHPPEMLDSRNARKFAVGAVGDAVTRDGDHVRAKIGIYDADTIAKMDAGKLDVSCGYNCDLEEKPGIDPVYGPYDAIQRNIVGNHVAIVDRGRAGTAKARMDGQTIVLDFSDDEERGPDGKWTGGSGSGNSGEKAVVKANPADFRAKLKASEESGSKAASEKANASGKLADHVSAYAAHMNAAALSEGKEADEHKAQAEKHHAAIEAIAAKGTSGSDAKLYHEHSQRYGSDHYVNPYGASISLDSVDECKKHAKLLAMELPTARIEVVVKTDSDEARRKPVVKADVMEPDTGDGDDDMEDQGEEGDEEDDSPDSYTEGTMDDSQTPQAPEGQAPAGPAEPDSDDRIAAHTYAVPGKKKLPIHSPEATQAAMQTGFAAHKFKSADEKHAAFNRIYNKAIQFGISRDQRHAFQAAHGGKLDRADGQDQYMNDLKKTQERLDAATEELAKAQGQIESLKKDLEAAKADASKARTDADDAAQARMDAKIDLLVKAKAAGAAVDSKMSERAIRVAVIKHVDKIDVADDKHDAYVEALYDGAISRAKMDAVETLVGAETLAAARETVETVRSDAAETRLDGRAEEEALAKKMKARSATAWTTSNRKEIK